jgi:hypothetical protein
VAFDSIESAWTRLESKASDESMLVTILANTGLFINAIHPQKTALLYVFIMNNSLIQYQKRAFFFLYAPNVLKIDKSHSSKDENLFNARTYR